MDYKNLASEILSNVGGRENVAAVTHCATRLRFNLKDNKKANVEKLKSIRGVLSVVEKGGQFQVVIGNEVTGVFRAVAELGNFTSGDSDGGSEDSVGIKGKINKVFDTISGIFTPFLPALTGAGMIKAVMALLVAFKLIDNTSQIYAILNFVGDAAFYFMPIMLAYSAAQKFKTNPYLAMTLGGILLHPNFINMVNAAKETGEPIKIILFNVPLVSYASSVIPIILSVWLMSYIHKFADKVSPTVVKFFLVPLITLIVTTPIMLILIGPLGNFLGSMVASGMSFLDARASWLTPTILGATSPLLVMAGMHYGIIPFGVNNLATAGYDTLVGPGMLASNIAQGGAALAVAFKTKNKDLKQLATSAGITAVCGITEPAMYGVTLKLKRPLYAVLIGGGLGGLFAGIFKVRRFMSGSPGLLTLPAYIGEPLSNFTFAIITCAISFVATFALTLLFGFEDPKENSEELNLKNKAIGNRELEEIKSPMDGKFVALNKVDDATFATEVLGKGFAINPREGRLLSPVKGTVMTVYATKHAICIKGDNGSEILLHVGLETVRLDGRYFECKVSEGDRVEAGTELLVFDIEKIKSEGYDLTTPVIITNADEYSNFNYKEVSEVRAGDVILTIS
jgi:PTS system, beta-glucoside-specific IIABC component